MQLTTEVGMNHSGMLVAEDGGQKMLENTELTKANGGDERELAKIRMDYAKEAEPVGTLPEPQPSGVARVLMDKLGERLAFERAGTRLYDALMVKCAADASRIVSSKEIKHIRDEEAVHFALVGAAIQSLGGDPTAQTPCADVTGVEGQGLMQVLTDPKTTVAQALHAILVAEMVDNAAWDELIELTEQAGNDDRVARLTKARDEEQEHLEKVQGWYKQATLAMAEE
jgi:ferritin-like protein